MVILEGLFQLVIFHDSMISACMNYTDTDPDGHRPPDGYRLMSRTEKGLWHAARMHGAVLLPKGALCNMDVYLCHS